MQPAARSVSSSSKRRSWLNADLRGHAARRGLDRRCATLLALGAPDVPAVQRVVQRRAVHRRQVAVEQTGAVEFAENGHDAAGAMNVLEMHVRHRGATLQSTGTRRDSRSMSCHGEGHLAFMGGGQQMQHRVGRSAHRDVQRHGVFERLEAGDAARQRRLVVLLVVAPRQIDDQMAGLDEQTLAVGMGRQIPSRCRAAPGPAPR